MDLNKETELELLEKINQAIRSENWKENTKDVIKPYKRIASIVKMLDLLIERNRLYEAKKYMQIQIENLNGITEQKCFKRKVRADYCEHCQNEFCNLNTTQKDKSYKKY